MGGGLGIWVKFHPRVLFLFFIFGSFNASTAYFHPKYRNTTLPDPVATVINFHVKQLHLTKAFFYRLLYRDILSFTFTD